MRNDTGRGIIAHGGAIVSVCPKILEWHAQLGTAKVGGSTRFGYIP